jgi:hypothetical protein
MLDCLIVVGHSPWRPGSRNLAADRRGDPLAYEFGFHSKLAPMILNGLAAGGVMCNVAYYQAGGGNVRRWSGASKLLIELHANAFDGKASGSGVVCADNRTAEGAAWILASPFQDALDLPLRGRHGAIVCHDDAGVRDGGRDRNGIGGGYLVYGCSQLALVGEPFFIDNDDDFALACSRMDRLATAYVEGIRALLAELPAA